ncbi:MAG TPA: putative toxin-antitoxin system toxin component, PIN family [Verrucomicrobia bacterium]|nr:putative toxin-antitoxin system toxin component, PIN family [Verrucomicrobiota bacterium]
MVAKITLRVVFDTNVILSALLFRSGRVSWLVPRWQQGQVVALLSKETASELLRVLAYPKFKLSHEEQQCILQAFVPYAETVVTRRSRHLPLCRDPHDQKFLILADQGNADYLVTGDDDLLTIKNFEPCPIITPEAFRGCQGTVL